MARAAHHPLVRDELTGTEGELMEIDDRWRCPETGRLLKLAFLRPSGGGREWTVEPSCLTYVETVNGKQR